MEINSTYYLEIFILKISKEKNDAQSKHNLSKKRPALCSQISMFILLKYKHLH